MVYAFLQVYIFGGGEEVRKKICVVGIICTMVFATGILIFLGRSRGGQKQIDNEWVDAEEYQAVFVSMYDISGFSQEDFNAYRGLETVCLQKEWHDYKDFVAWKEEVFSKSRTLQVVYMGIDPIVLWRTAGCREDKWTKDLQDNIGTMIEENSDISFEITLPFPQQDYWIEMSEEEFAECRAVYQKAVDILDAYSNTILYYYGAEEWLIGNLQNYKSDFGLNSEMSHFFLLSTVCDRKFVVDSETMQTELDKLHTYILEEKNNPTIYPDLTGWDIVFFGDSIIALEESSSAVPEVVAGFSGATVYDCAKGGTTATDTGKDEFHFAAVAEVFLTGQTGNYPIDENLIEGTNAFNNRPTPAEKICFVINFGLNDHYGGCKPDNPEEPWDTKSYGGALRNGIRQLKEKYPQALVIIATPSYISTSNFGMMPTGDEGYVLPDYVEVAKQVAKDMGVICLDNYVQLGITADNYEDYLLDGCHMNGRGRMAYAKYLLETLKKYS